MTSYKILASVLTLGVWGRRLLTVTMHFCALLSSTQNRYFWIIHKIHRKNLCSSLFLIRLQFCGPATLLKKNPTQVLSCEIRKLFKNNYFEEHLRTSASKLYLKRDSNTGVFLWILRIIQEHLFCKGSTKVWFWNTCVGVSL